MSRSSPAWGYNSITFYTWSSFSSVYQYWWSGYREYEGRAHRDFVQEHYLNNCTFNWNQCLKFSSIMFDLYHVYGFYHLMLNTITYACTYMSPYSRPLYFQNYKWQMNIRNIVLLLHSIVNTVLAAYFLPKIL